MTPARKWITLALTVVAALTALTVVAALTVLAALTGTGIGLVITHEPKRGSLGTTRFRVDQLGLHAPIVRRHAESLRRARGREQRICHLHISLIRGTSHGFMEDPKTPWDLPTKEGEMNPAETPESPLPPPESPLPPASVIRAIAEHAQVDRKTVNKWLRGLSTRPKGAARIAAALTALKLHDLAASRAVACAAGSTEGGGRSR